jgi:aminoglycoside/choline kinase family phosphotransferase
MHPWPALSQLLQRFTGQSGPLVAWQMPGGASTRRFYRVQLGSVTAVAMYVPDATQPEEIAKVDESNRRWPFLEVRELLEKHGVRVPRLLAEACADGLILVEDLGDDTLDQFLAREPEQRQRLYQIAVTDLARAHRALGELPQACIIRTRAFDRDLLRWELDHFREWGLQARGIELAAAQRTEFQVCADYLAETIAAWPRGFVHRDYQSRNLMVRLNASRAPELVWIDFQDALLGPRVYDLVALLNDSYQSLEPAFVQARLDEYAQELGLDRTQRRQLGREFGLVTVQRKLKDAGRFVFIDQVKRNPCYLQFVEPTLDRVFAALVELDDDPYLARLAALLREVLPDRAAADRTGRGS